MLLISQKSQLAFNVVYIQVLQFYIVLSLLYFIVFVSDFYVTVVRAAFTAFPYQPCSV